jgi:thiol:disulfide interchange protein DsbD
VPEDAVLKLSLPVTPARARRPAWGAKIAQTLADAPKPAGPRGAFEKQGEVVKLAITGAALKGADLAGAYFYPSSARSSTTPSRRRSTAGPTA